MSVGLRRRGARTTIGLALVALALFAVGSLGASIGSRNGAAVVEYQYPQVDLTASPIVVSPGQTSTLTWTSTDVTSCTGYGDWSGPMPLNGSRVVTVWGWEHGFYSLDCTGPDGETGGGVQVIARQQASERASVDQRQYLADDTAFQDAVAQTFTVGLTGWLTDVNLNGTGANSYDQVAITRTTPSGAPNSAAVLTSTTVASQGTGGNIRLPKRIFVIAGEHLAITLIAPNGRTDPNDDYVYENYVCSTDLYTGGASYHRDQNGVWTQSPSCDNVFTTYVIQQAKIGH